MSISCACSSAWGGWRVLSEPQRLQAALAAWRTLLGDVHVQTDAATLARLRQDTMRSPAHACARLRPANSEEVAACLAVVRETAAGHGLRHLIIDASGSPEEVARQTRRMFAYAAELDLDAKVYELLRPIAPASILQQCRVM